MIGKVTSINNGMIAVDVDGIVYITGPSLSIKFRHKIKVGDKVLLDSETFKIIEIL